MSNPNPRTPNLLLPLLTLGIFNLSKSFKEAMGILDTAVGTILTGSKTYDAASLTDGTGATTTVTVTGAELGDFAQASLGVDVSGITVTAWVSADDTVSVRLQNESGGTLDLASTTLRALVRKA